MPKVTKAVLRPAFLGALFIALTTIPAGATAQTDNGITYQMQQGDSLNALNARFFRGANAVNEIARLNGIRNPRRIPVGTEIRVPRRLLAFRTAALRVRSFSGQVDIDGNAPTAGIQIAEGATITTGAGGFITFESADGAVVALPSNSRARLERARIYALRDLRDIEFRILNGRGEIRAPTLREQERFNTSTPVAVTAVRGTEYRVGYIEATGTNLTEVTEGEVSVDNAAVSELAGAGWGMAVRESGLDALTQLLPPVELAEPGAIQTAETVSFTVMPPEGAVAARTQIARDAGFLEMIAEDVSEDGTADFTELEDGRYFVRARGISAAGLEGLSEIFSFRRKRLGAEAVVETSPLADGFRFAWLPQGEGITHFAFQLWRQGEAATPLYDEIALPGSATVVTGLEPGTYLWRIAAIQADAEDGLLKVWGPEQSLMVSPE